jgi:hypothetical protein
LNYPSTQVLNIMLGLHFIVSFIIISKSGKMNIIIERHKKLYWEK